MVADGKAEKELSGAIVKACNMGDGHAASRSNMWEGNDWTVSAEGTDC